MGCYGIGPGRAMGSVVEIHHDDKGIIWPAELSPYKIHLVLISENRKKEAEKIYHDLTKQEIEVLFDDRGESAGVKLKDADLIGISLQLILGDKTKDKIEYRRRDGSDDGVVNSDEIVKLLK